MQTTHLRKVGGSVMLAVPPSLLESLDLRAGAKVSIELDDGRLIIAPNPRPRYSLDELLAQCDPSRLPPADEQAWLAVSPVGDELL